MTSPNMMWQQGYDKIIEMKDDKDKGTRRTQNFYKYFNQLRCNISNQLMRDLTLSSSCHIICTCVSCTVENVECRMYSTLLHCTVWRPM